MQLVDAATVSSGDEYIYGGGEKRTALWKIMNHTAVSTTVIFSGRHWGDTTITIPAANASFIDVYGDFSAVAPTGAQLDFMVFV